MWLLYRYAKSCIVIFNKKGKVKYMNPIGRKLFSYHLSKEDFIKNDSIDIIPIFKNTVIIKKREQDFIQDIEDLTNSGHWQWRIDNGELIWSRGLKRIYELEKVNYEQYMNCNHPDDRKLIQEIIDKCLIDKKEYTKKHRIIKNKTGNQAWIKSIGRFIEKEGVSYLIGSVQDITDQVKIEKDYCDKKTKAEEESKTKSDFVSSVSHELRTPLNGIIGMVSLLQETELSELQKRYTGILHDSCGVLLSIINNILNFSKFQSGKMLVDLEHFDVKKFLVPVISLFRPSAMLKGLALNFYIDSTVDYITSDELKIKQIVSNLLSNSIKFTKKGSVSLFVKCDEKQLIITATDTGIGISTNFLKVIKTPFTQEDGSCTKEFGGSGLGLSIVHSYIELLKGDISIKSNVGKGTEIILRIPITTSKMVKSIVIVEDNQTNQIILKEILKNLGDFHIITYSTAEEALEKIKEEPSIIFMDLHMPRMDGFTCSTKIREIGYTCPIIAYSANFMKSQRIKCLQSNMDDFLIKPVKKEDVKKILLDFKIKS